MNLSLAISTCPNDTFIFEALVNNRIDTHGLSFNLHMADIEELNTLALNSQADVIKLSYAVYPWVSASYQMLNAGSALGKGVGPLVVSKRKIYPDELHDASVAIPGEKTTANLLFSIFFPSAKQKSVVLFSDIEEAVASNAFDVGVIIHESRFTYQKKGLQKVADLGEIWEKSTQLPIPLGGIAIRRSLPETIKKRVEASIRSSLEFAFANSAITEPFVRMHAQEMDAETIWKHIGLYVNNYSLNLASEGKRAIEKLWSESHRLAGVSEIQHPAFLEY